MTGRERRRLQQCAAGFVACMLAISIDARFVRPEVRWPAWVALILMVPAMLCLALAWKTMQDVERRRGEEDR